jgi:AAA family ATP:ADP antiporter
MIRAATLFQRAVDVREREIGALFWSCAYFFFVLSSYYVLRPMREEAGVAGGVENLPWLFTGTLLGMLLVHPLFAGAVTRWPRRRFVPLTYRFFMFNLVLFFLLFRAAPEWNLWIGRIFFMWLSVFNLFVVSVFWSFMTDIYHTDQSKRLFGFIALGGTLGAIAGSSIPAFLAVRLGPVNLLIIAIALLEMAVFTVHRLSRLTSGFEQRGRVYEGPAEGVADEEVPDRAVPDQALDEAVIGGSFIDGVTHVVRSRYLVGIVVYMLLFTIASTFLYFQQAEIVGRTFTDRAVRTAVFGRIDLAVNLLTVVTQAFLTGRILRWLGIGLTLAILPAVTVFGFSVLGTMPVLAALVIFQVLRRSTNFALARPTREVLYTVLPREDKYKAKNFIDTFVYRAGDQVGAWSYAFMGWLGLGISALAFTMVPLAAVWLLVGLWLGREQQRAALATQRSMVRPAA